MILKVFSDLNNSVILWDICHAENLPMLAGDTWEHGVLPLLSVNGSLGVWLSLNWFLCQSGANLPFQTVIQSHSRMCNKPAT